jgi:hypothetical protein
MLSIQSSRVWQPAAGSNDCFAHFYKKFLLAGSGVAARCWLYWLFGTLQMLKKARVTAITVLSAAGCHTWLDHSAE